MRAIILLTLAGLGLAGCSNVFDKHVEYKYVEPNNYPILKAVGYAPISLQQGANKSQKQLMAINVAGAIAQNDYMESKVQGIIKGAQIIKTYSVDDVYVTELELNMKRVHDLYIGEIKPREVKKVTYY